MGAAGSCSRAHAGPVRQSVRTCSTHPFQRSQAQAFTRRGGIARACRRRVFTGATTTSGTYSCPRFGSWARRANCKRTSPGPRCHPEDRLHRWGATPVGCGPRKRRHGRFDHPPHEAPRPRAGISSAGEAIPAQAVIKRPSRDLQVGGDLRLVSVILTQDTRYHIEFRLLQRAQPQPSRSR